MIRTIAALVCLIAYGIFYYMAGTYRCSPGRISNRVVQLYTNIINNPAWYDDNSYFASAITSTTLDGNIYTAYITTYGDGNTAAEGTVYTDDWIKYTQPNCDTYVLVDAKISGIAPSWKAYVNTGPYFGRLLHKKYITMKIGFATRTGLANAFYNITGSRQVATATGFRLYYQYQMTSDPPQLVLPTMFSLMAYRPCVASCLNNNNAIACYLANVAAARIKVTQPNQPMIWELAGSDDTGEDYIDIDLGKNILGGRFTYWGHTFMHDAAAIDHMLVGMNNTANYKLRKKITGLVKFLRSGTNAKGSWAQFLHSDGSTGTETYDAFGRFIK